MNYMSSNADSSRDRPASIAAIVLLGAVAVAGFNIQPMYLGALADHLGFSAEQLGLIAGAEIAGGALAGVAAISWVRRWNWQRVALVALLVLGIGNLASAYVTNFESLVVIRFLTGFLGIGTNYALAIAALSDTHHTERNFSIAVVTQVSIAMAGFMILPSFIGESGTSAVFLPLAAIAFLLVPFLKFLPVGGQRESVAVTEMSMCLVPRHRRGLGVRGTHRCGCGHRCRRHWQCTGHWHGRWFAGRVRCGDCCRSFWQNHSICGRHAGTGGGGLAPVRAGGS
jgi:MFS family permease